MKPDSDNGDSLLDKIKRIVTSTLIFFTAFVTSSALLQILIGLFCKALGYTVDITYNKVKVMPLDYHYWSRFRVMFAYALPPFVCLVIGLLLMSNLVRLRSEINLFRAFRMWFMFCLINLFLGHLLIAPIGLYSNRIMGFYQTFAVLGSWMGLNVPALSILAVISIVGSLGFGVFIRNEVLKFSPSSRDMKRSSGKVVLIFQLFLLPVALAFIPIATVCTRDYFFPTVFILLNFFIISLGMFTRTIFDNQMVRCGKYDVLNRWPAFELTIAGLVWAGIFLYFK